MHCLCEKNRETIQVPSTKILVSLHVEVFRVSQYEFEMSMIFMSGIWFTM